MLLSYSWVLHAGTGYNKYKIVSVSVAQSAAKGIDLILPHSLNKQQTLLQLQDT